MIKNSDITYKGNIGYNYILLGVLFLLSPLLGIMLTLYYIMHTPYSKKKIWLLLFMCISWVSFVNMCKVPENDLVQYLDAFKLAGRVGFSEWYSAAKSNLAVPLKDYGFMTYLAVLSHFVSKNVYVFKWATSIIVYTIMGVSLVKGALKFKLPVPLVVTLVCFLFFTPYIFTMSLHIIRQFMASAILFFLLVRRTYYVEWKEFIKNNWLYLVLMTLFHKSSLLFVILLMTPFLGESVKNNKLKYLALFALLIIYQRVAVVVLAISSISSDSTLGTTLERASNNTIFELEALTPIHILLISMFAFLSLIVAYKSKYSKHAGVKHVYNVVLILAVFILMNLHQLELSVRLYNYLICFLPFAALPFLMKVRSSFLLYMMCMVVIICWILYIKYGVWTFDIPGNVMLTPILGYLL